MMFILY